MRGPGDRATKSHVMGEPTLSFLAEGHDGGPRRVGVDHPFPPGSKSSARAQLSPGRELGGLEGASPSMVEGRQPREGRNRKPWSEPSRSRTWQ